ncbi:MAG: hypothetical protein WBD47_06825 [Phormidesmis sp.]
MLRSVILYFYNSRVRKNVKKSISNDAIPSLYSPPAQAQANIIFMPLECLPLLPQLGQQTEHSRI